MSQAVIKVNGMNCNHCKMAVERSLKALPGVQSAEVTLSEKLVAVNYDPGKVDLDTMKAAIRNAGYDPK